ncbi:hypothetical protein K402DRAFT_423903 [Aulographum hederae CBS 113979]|uniref:Uncharacterized protein n=1 Tax=Aulographum hederae CBS 113979 TaxID=1176131 RepID=A0A6G1GRA3_9PEZI|nr:hypothetical protein K402DRAFT_423903 [Aulographum hederae CBS 113979]
MPKAMPPSPFIITMADGPKRRRRSKPSTHKKSSSAALPVPPPYPEKTLRIFRSLSISAVKRGLVTTPRDDDMLLPPSTFGDELVADLSRKLKKLAPLEAAPGMARSRAG